MFIENSDRQQMKPFSTLNDMRPRLKKKLEKSWAQVFYYHVFCQIDESQFAPLYCPDNGRPNFPVNILVCLEAIKHLFDYTGKEILDEYSFNYLVNYAVGILTLGELPLAEKMQEMLDMIHELLKIASSHSRLKELEGIKVAGRFLKEQAYYDYKRGFLLR